MGYADRLSIEINTLLDELAAEGREWRASWIAQEICSRHTEVLGEGDDADFWLHCGHSDCRREVTRCINRRAGDRPDADSGQLALPGYEHIHAYYVVKRDGEDVGVSVHHMSDHEIESKESQYRAMGVACFAHALELRRFRDERLAA